MVTNGSSLVANHSVSKLPFKKQIPGVEQMIKVRIWECVLLGVDFKQLGAGNNWFIRT